MKVKPSVSVLVLNYNGGEILFECLRSLQQTEYSGELQIIVIDNASTDNSASFVERDFENVTLVKNSQNLGYSTAYNRAAELCKSELLVFLNNDVVVEPDWLLHLVATYLGHEQTGAVSATFLQYDSQPAKVQNAGITLFPNGYGRDRGVIAHVSGEQEFETYLPYFQQDKQVDALSGGALLIGRDLFLTLNGFDAHFFMYYEDVDVSLRIRALGYNLWVSGDSKIWHHHAYSSSEYSSFFLHHTEKGHLLLMSKHGDFTSLLEAWAEHIGLLGIAVWRCLYSLSKGQGIKSRKWLKKARLRAMVLFETCCLFPFIWKKRLALQLLPWKEVVFHSFRNI